MHKSPGRRVCGCHAPNFCFIVIFNNFVKKICTI
nr:MAG TPA: hypothetical protein [Bacteriophage sp.]